MMSADRGAAEDFLGELRATMHERNVYRGQVLALDCNRYGGWQLRIRKLPRIERDQIVLAAGVLERVERQTVDFARHSQQLRAAGRHLKRGVLLHGPPGTGKTLTAMYLAGLMPDRTTLVLTGTALGGLARCCAIARSLQPALMVLEDVDLVAEERGRPGAGGNPLLFELLNQMDGMAEDADVIFLLATNRPDLIEPALAARPGRIDQAVEVGLPDAAGRRRLIELYARGLTLRVGELDRFVERSEGASAAFIRELLRKAALFAAIEDQAGVVEERHLAAALDELLGAGGELTKNLLGMGVRTAGRWHQELLQRSRGRHANGVAGGDYDGDGRNAEATPPDPPVQ
jgi:cell division protease FtsH